MKTKKKALVALMLAALTLGSMLVGFAPATNSVTVGVPQTATTTATTTSTVNLRASASTTAKIIVRISKGKTVTIISQSGSWYKVKYGTKTGYILGQYLKFKSSGTTTNSQVIGKIGHISMPNTKVDNDIYLAVNNTYFVTHNKSGKVDVNGEIFMDFRNRDNTRKRNIILYGHNMKSGKMFRTLHNYESKTFFDANQTFTVTLFDKVYTYKVFAVGKYKLSNFTYRTKFSDSADFANYINGTILAGATYKSGWTSNGSQDIITLSTCCGDHAYRWILFGYMV